jgi:phenylalanyl-tRNA synthetase beta chain
MKTAECEGIEPVGAHFNAVVVARVLTVEPIPNGKNKAVQVEVGRGKIVKVVCGAPNVRPGLLAPWVPPGTSLGGPTISRAVIEGVESEGMLASAAELGINRDHSGILELQDGVPGERLKELSPDWIIDIDNKSLTHRPDLWGHYGMAREISAITNGSLRDPVNTEFLPQGEPAVAVAIADHTLCPRYSALVLEDIAVTAPPLWLQWRLQSVGLNPINNIVDVTNFILAELPQPMHAFDAEKLTGGTIFVRRAQAGEELRALNGETYALAETDLVIADGSGPIALAGVIGGADTAISETTTRVVLESANFQAASVRLTSARHRLRTDASMRFEKALDPENTLRGLARAVDLFREVAPSTRASGGVTDNRSPLRPICPIALPMDFVVRKLGKQIGQPVVSKILHALGFEAAETAPGVLTVTVPSWRATKDIALKDDLVEEVGRMVGYDEIPPQAPLVASVVPPANATRIYLRQVRSELAAQGFTEVYNYSFLNQAEASKFLHDTGDFVSIRNPIASDLTHLRRSLLPGLFKNIINNVRHYSEFRLFEIGAEIHPQAGTSLPDEVTHAAAVLYSIQGNEQDFFELKRVVECVWPGARLTAVPARAYEHPVRAAEVQWQNSAIGRIFELHPLLLESEGIEGRAMLFDVDLRVAQQLASTREVRYSPLRKYPSSGFDLSVVTRLKTPVARVQDELTALAGSDLVMIDFLRQYDGPPLAEGQKSVSYHLEVAAPDHTLSAEEVASIRNRIMDGMRELGYDFRV